MGRHESVERIEEIRDEIEVLVEEARSICMREKLDMNNLDTFVFGQIREHLKNASPYNQSLSTIMTELIESSAQENEA